MSDARTANDVVLEATDLAVARNGETIWTHGTFSVERGSVVAVIGPNGAGKTTLLQVILGALAPSTGGLCVLGSEAGHANERIGYVPQHYATGALDAVRSRDLVALGRTGRRFGMRRSTAADRSAVDSALASVGALELADRRVSRLSGGQQQRVAIARALVGNPELLLLDEPLASLDLRNQHAIVDLLGRLRAERDLTILIVAHDLNPLLSIATSAIYLLDGHAHHGAIGDVVDAELLSHLYGTDVRVVRTPQGELFTRNA